MIQFNERLCAEIRSDYSASSLSGKLFSAYTQSAGFTYRIGMPDSPPKIVEEKKPDYYGDGMHSLSQGDIVHARELFLLVDRNDPAYLNAHNLVVDIDSSLRAYEEGKRLISENKKAEAIPFLEKASPRIVGAGNILESIRFELRKEIPALEKNGIAAYDSNDYARCISIMKRIILIDPNNQTAKTYLPRAEKRDEALRKLK